MCGRFANTTSPDMVKAKFRLTSSVPGSEADGGRGHNAEPRWNIAPSMMIDTVIRAREGAQLTAMEWGLNFPHLSRPLINARAETMFEKQTFAASARHRRCIVVASGWYEWKATKQPYFIQPEDEMPMAMAGLFWEEEKGRQCVIVTTSATGDLAAIHHRSPVVLEADRWQTWLDPSSQMDEIDHLTKPENGSMLKWHPVSAEVGSTRVNHSGLIERDDQHGQKPPAQMDLF